MRIKKIKFEALAYILLFITYVFLNFYNIGIKELQGDEASSLLAVIPAMKFYKNPAWLASIFLFSHAPLRGLVETPFLYVFGLKEFWLYLPNILASLGLFWINFLILKKWFGSNAALIGSVFLSINGGIVLQRMVMGVGFFVFFTSFMIFNFYSFLQTKKTARFNFSLLGLFLAILAYVEAVIFIPVVLYWLKKKNLLGQKEVLKKLVNFFILLFVFFGLWLAVPLLANKHGFISSLNDAGIMRIIKRVSGGFYYNPGYGFKMLRYYNSFSLVILLMSGLFFSIFEKKAFFYWSFLAPPLIYFSIIKNPTVHLFNYLNLIIIISSIGWQKFLSFFKNSLGFFTRLSFFIILFTAIYFNLSFLKAKFYTLKNSKDVDGWGALSRRGLKSKAYYIRSKTHRCDKIYTDIEGYVARLYFGRRYTKDPIKAKIQVFKKDLKFNEAETKLFDRKYSSFTHLMPYLGCKN